MKPAAPSTGSPVIVVAIGIVERDGAYLVTRRPQGSHLEGMWEFPGGKLEPGESPAEAVARELREEVGAVVTTARPLTFAHHRYDDREVLLLFHRCLLAETPTRSPEGLEMRWATLDELRELPFPPANREALEALARH